MEPLVTNDLANDFDAIRDQLVDNFVKIQQGVNDGMVDRATIDGFKKKLDQLLTDSKIRVANVQAIVKILSDYDVPIAIVDGKVTRTEEGE
ncbi:hypothetical protein H0E85_05065 [Lactiplantibacillus plantarum]|uniref:hypothetical protein n=1 Tax=Lactiplantibacillus plantarum TaxID=1590 RepID=UPI0015EC80DF|nr:hypothetical protein [Lactiplantibacillus plantarum]QLQ50965.1 hypothetical protein H0E85_05065 [Lactiplantibacillus plantarum]